MSIESVMPSNHLILCHPLLLPPSIFPASGSFPMSQFTSSGQSIKSFSFSINPSNEYSGLISFRIDWLDLLAVQGTLKSFLQYHISKTSALRHSAFFIVQLSYPYLTTRKIIRSFKSSLGLPNGRVVKNPSTNGGDPGSIPGLRSKENAFGR